MCLFEQSKEIFLSFACFECEKSTISVYEMMWKICCFSKDSSWTSLNWGVNLICSTYEMHWKYVSIQCARTKYLLTDDFIVFSLSAHRRLCEQKQRKKKTKLSIYFSIRWVHSCVRMFFILFSILFGHSNEKT